MKDYKLIGIDLAKRNFHLAAINSNNKVIMKKAVKRDIFIENLTQEFAPNQTFCFEACSGAHNIGQILESLGHKVIALKPKDVKAYAKSRQKNDINDAISICKAALDPDLKRVRLKTKEEQSIAYFHKTRQKVIHQRIELSNSLLSSLHEFGYIVNVGKSQFAKDCEEYVQKAYNMHEIGFDVYQEMLDDCEAIKQLIHREKQLDKLIVNKNKQSPKAMLLTTIPGIGPINASILSNKPMDAYDNAKDFSASLGIVPRQNTTGGIIKLGSITKQGDRYARTMLIQAARTVVIRAAKKQPPLEDIYQLVKRLKAKGKHFNVICVAVANKLARIAYACVNKNSTYQKLEKKNH